MNAPGGFARRFAYPRRGLPTVFFLTDSHRVADPLATVAGLPRGSAVILRDYDCRDRPRLARALAQVCRSRHVRLLVAGDSRLARAVGADGVHLPERAARHGLRSTRALRPGWLVTAAAHSPAAIRRAAAVGVDAVLLSPVFATPSHPDAPPLGVIRFARWARSSPVPVYALGGVSPATVRRLRAGGAAGVAGIGAFDRKTP